MMARFDISFGDYVLVVPGGGTDHPGAENAPQIVAEAARRIAETRSSHGAGGRHAVGVARPAATAHAARSSRACRWRSSRS